MAFLTVNPILALISTFNIGQKSICILKNRVYWLYVLLRRLVWRVTFALREFDLWAARLCSHIREVVLWTGIKKLVSSLHELLLSQLLLVSFLTTVCQQLIALGVVWVHDLTDTMLTVLSLPWQRLVIHLTMTLVPTFNVIGAIIPLRWNLLRRMMVIYLKLRFAMWNVMTSGWSNGIAMLLILARVFVINWSIGCIV